MSGSRAVPSVRAALVTGAGRGIGCAVALELARAGFGVLVNYARNRQTASETRDAVRDIGVPCWTCRADIARDADRRRLVATCLRRFGRIDLLVNNAGIAPSKRDDILDAGQDEFDRVLAVNLKGPYFLTQLVAREMIARHPAAARKAPGNSTSPANAPKIVTISSVSAFVPSTNRGEYCISKAGLSMMTRLYAARLAEEGIGVYEIQPGLILTDMTAPVRARYDALIRDGRVPLGRWGRPQDVARAVRTIAEGSLDYSTGEVIRVDGGFHLPRL